MLQLVISIGHFGIQTAVMTLSSFRACSRHGHLDRAKCIFGYIKKFEHTMICIRTNVPDFTGLPDPTIDWSTLVCRDYKEILASDAPEPLCKAVITSTYVDANLMHDLLSGNSVTGVLHLLNKTPIDWYSKKQGTIKTATFVVSLWSSCEY